MTKIEIVQRIVLNHNRLAGMFASGALVIQNADSVIVMGDTIRDLRDLTQTLQEDINGEQTRKEEEKTGKK